MNKYIRNAILPFFICLVIVNINFSQDNSDYEFIYEVNRVNPPVKVTKAKLNMANTLLDLNKRYESTWVEEYLSVEISAFRHGEIQKAFGKSENLSQEQKDLMKNADVGSAISVTVHYMPENNLTHNDAKEMDFTFTVEPDNEAEFAGGQDQLSKYFKENAIDKVTRSSFKQYKLAAYKFTIDESGKVVDPMILWSSEDDEIDGVMLGSICNMPQWTPAAYDDGTKISQEYVLAVGDKYSCVMNLLSINQD